MDVYLSFQANLNLAHFLLLTLLLFIISSKLELSPSISLHSSLLPLLLSSFFTVISMLSEQIILYSFKTLNQNIREPCEMSLQSDFVAENHRT
jgi:hypothetical protein